MREQDEGFVAITAMDYNEEEDKSSYKFTWYDGDICRLSFSFLEQSDPDAIEWDRVRGFKGMILGDLIQIGPFVLEVLAVDFESNIVRCRREREKEEVVNDK